ncbi:ABC transporter substrate-binding protein [Ruminococcus gauvreauii]|uniref:ABC transporter substrate-binding protein n=1 Tax=Ruminococcus gauvreauii TaxID=438033 RepID=A0ABY5VIW3_9FIRM|nr:ABC transporter substrate-binding protein [Ruminococcus gauvreauii]UWP60535.1 ABC transporter substrate-binding protein [Ruminococcus gauvreauii]
MKGMKKVISLLLVLAMTTALCACGGKKEEANEGAGDTGANEAAETKSDEKKDGELTPSGDTVNIAALINTDGLAVWYADKMGYFEELGLKTNITYFVNGTLENEALSAGEAEIGFNGFAGVYALATGDYTMVADCDDGKGLAVYVDPKCPVVDVQGEYSKENPDVYGNAETAAGLSFGVTLGTVQQIMVDSYYANLGQKDYNLVSMDAASCYNALISGEVDGAALTMNYCAAAEAAGMVCLGTYEGITGVGTGSTVIVPNDYLESNRDDIVLTLKAVFKALDEIQNDEQLEFDQGMEFFKEMGTEYTEDEMWTEINVRDLYSYEKLKELKYGNHVVFSAIELTKLGLLDEGSAEAVAKSINKDLLEEATGVSITVEMPEGY